MDACACLLLVSESTIYNALFSATQFSFMFHIFYPSDQGFQVEAVVTFMCLDAHSFLLNPGWKLYFMYQSEINQIV